MIPFYIEPQWVLGYVDRGCGGQSGPQMAPSCLSVGQEHVQACPCVSLARDHSGPLSWAYRPPASGALLNLSSAPQGLTGPWQAMALAVRSGFLLISGK